MQLSEPMDLSFPADNADEQPLNLVKKKRPIAVVAPTGPHNASETLCNSEEDKKECSIKDDDTGIQMGTDYMRNHELRALLERLTSVREGAISGPDPSQPYSSVWDNLNQLKAIRSKCHDLQVRQVLEQINHLKSEKLKLTEEDKMYTSVLDNLPNLDNKYYKSNQLYSSVLENLSSYSQWKMTTKTSDIEEQQYDFYTSVLNNLSTINKFRSSTPNPTEQKLYSSVFDNLAKTSPLTNLESNKQRDIYSSMLENLSNHNSNNNKEDSIESFYSGILENLSNKSSSSDHERDQKNELYTTVLENLSKLHRIKSDINPVVVPIPSPNNPATAAQAQTEKGPSSPTTNNFSAMLEHLSRLNAIKNESNISNNVNNQSEVSSSTKTSFFESLSRARAWETSTLLQQHHLLAAAETQRLWHLAWQKQNQNVITKKTGTDGIIGGYDDADSTSKGEKTNATASSSEISVSSSGVNSKRKQRRSSSLEQKTPNSGPDSGNKTGGQQDGSGPGTNGQDKKKPHIKKPLNAFMLYMKEMRAKVVAECTLKESAAINQILGRRWHSLTRDEQAKYYEKARQERQLHMQLYPGWSARDNYGYGAKKKKRKKERQASAADLGGNSMKKCRARYGLDQQSQWCKPCRRKKKCIRYMESGDSGDGNQSEDNLGSCGSVGEAQTPPDDESLHQSLSSPGGLSGLSSLTSPSMILPSPGTSLASPSVSLASPCMSLQSPLTPHEFECKTPLGAGSGGGGGGGGVGGGGGCVPPPSHHIGPPLHRHPVGTNPHDINNPLSVNQLTGQCVKQEPNRPGSGSHATSGSSSGKESRPVISVT